MEIKPPLETTTHLVAHSLREIESALRDVLEPVADQAASPKEKKSRGGSQHRTEILSVLKGLGIPETGSVAQAWLKTADQGSSYRLHARAHRNALATPHPSDADFRQFWNDMEAILDVVLDKFESTYFSVFKFLDKLLIESVPREDGVKKLRDHIPNNQVAFSYFFDKLTDSTWLEPLKTGGFFNYPPEPIREGGYIRFPIWPESQYLTRMALLAPKLVLDVILKLPPTENIRVHEDLAAAVLTMPADMAAQWAKIETRWVEQQEQIYFYLLPERLGTLVEYLAKGGQTKAAISLAQALLAVLPDKRTTEESDEEQIRLLPPEPRARFDLWNYEQILKKNVPGFVAVAKEDAFKLLCDLLETAICLSQNSTEDKGPEDYSYIWRPQIEDHDRNRRHDLKNLLISTVRDAAEQLAKTNPTQVPSLVQSLEQRSWHIFHRISLHLLRRFPDVAPQLVLERLTKQTLLHSVWSQNEYRQLLKERFLFLSSQEQEKWLHLIKEGPILDSGIAGEPLPRDFVEGYAVRWRRERLAPVVDYLPEDWRLQHQVWCEDLTPYQTDIEPVSVSWGDGSPNPKSAEDLRLMSTRDIVDFLKNWQPDEHTVGPFREGLRQALKTAVTSVPERFAADATLWKGLHPTYVYALLSGLNDVVRQKSSPIPWSPILNLCQWVATQHPEDAEDQREGVDIDIGWNSTRRAVAYLLSDGVHIDDSRVEIPFELRKLVWNVIKPLTNDPDPTPEHEARYGGPNMEPATLSINTTRGEAMHTVIRYALWVRKHIEKEPEGITHLKRGFDEMPEVREVLEVHLNPARDPSLAIRSVYGQWFPWFVLVDQKWTAAHVTFIFPTDEAQAGLRNAAWEPYITFCDAYDSAFDVLREEYRHAIECLSISQTRRVGRDAPDQRLVEHLMILYWRGHIPLDEQTSLLSLFYEKASQTLHGHAREFIGRNLSQGKDPVPPEIIDRLKMLWDWRFAAVQKATSPASHSAELISFSWWFSSGKFDDTWALPQLAQVLKLLTHVEVDRWIADELVAERLAIIANDFPRESIECLALMVEAVKEPWRIDSWKDHARTILSTGLQSFDTQTREEAEDLVNRLMALGHIEFRNLLQK